MKKALSVILALLMCFCLMGCSGSKIPNLYKNIATEFLNGIGSTSLEEVKSYAESTNLKFEKGNMNNSYKISNGGKWDVSFYFSYDDKLSVISFHEVNGERAIHISRLTISYTYGENDKRFSTIADCERYVFGAVSGIDFAVEKDTSSSSTQSSSTSKPINGNSSSSGISLRYGKLVSQNVNGTTLVIKAKIEPSYSNKATVDQNYYNIEDIVKKQGGSKYKEIQYWAVADMSNGSEQKVVSFTVPENVIKKIANDQIVANQMGNYVDDLFIHASLR